MIEPKPDKPLIYDLDFLGLVEIFESFGEPEYRARQIWQGLYQKLWNDPAQFTNLPLSLRYLLDDNFQFRHLQPIQVFHSKDAETTKTLFALPGGQPVEAVLMRYHSLRRSICISAQSGCVMGCLFCATGQMGFRSNLTSGEIIEQVLYYAQNLAKDDERITNVVIMGMGEPFHNYTETLAAVDRLNHPKGFNLGARRFTISTVGLVPMIERFTAEKRQVNLSVSLHAADNELRSTLLPINRKYPIDRLMKSCLNYIEATGRRISFEWALIHDINDSPQQAVALGHLLQPFRRSSSTLCHVNIIPLNPTGKYRGKATSKTRAEIFRSILENNGIPCTLRVRRGIDIQAGCGQLAVEVK